jgi:subtilisin family serine protease
MRLKGKLGGGLLAAALITGVVPAAAASTVPSTGGSKPAGGFRTVTRVTGDRLTVATDGSNRTAIQPGKGREKVRFLQQTVRGHLNVIPADAAPLVAAGRLDRRLFDVTTLLEYGYDDRRATLPLIVTYGGGVAAKAAVTPGTTVVRDLPAVGGVAVNENRRDAGAFWKNLTAVKAFAGPGTRVLLDGKRKPLLDRSVPQIGAPQAWQAGYTGSGVPVAIVDTGIDATHPDLAGKVAAAANFTGDGKAGDDVGHGTHVASTVAGTGAASAGKYKGVAPDAKLYDAKVCNWTEGCQESWIVAGMQWAVAEQHAKVVNMSLGGEDTPEVDPLEQAVQTLTAQYGALFVIAAGNSGADETIGSPASADDALAVAAVDKSDQLAPFSSRGPRSFDAALKPEITAPGVDIVAARSKDNQISDPTGPDGRYTTLSGTSMATPHVAGAAAILAQQHPDWKPGQLKTALVNSAKPNPDLGVYAQGAGRVDVARAITQNVLTTPATVSFGRQFWPHGDDQPISRTINYHNGGTSAITLDLALTSKGPDGKPAPAGMFTLGATKVTVPAGGDAQVPVTADTRGAGPDGYAGGLVTATAGDVVVRTPIAVDKEVESYDVSLSAIDRAGKPASAFSAFLIRTDKPNAYRLFDPSGTVKTRLPKGRYVVTTAVFGGSPESPEFNMLVTPEVVVDKAQSLTYDARQAKPVSVTVPRPEAKAALAFVGFNVEFADGGFGSGVIGNTFDGIYTAQVGAGRAAGFVANVTSQWGVPDTDGAFRNSPYSYALAWYEKGRFFTGLRRAVKDRDVATVKADLGVAAPGASGERAFFGRSVDGAGSGWSGVFTYDLPRTTTGYYNSEGGGQWSTMLAQTVPSTDPQFPFPMLVSENDSAYTTYRAGRTYHEAWNRGVFGPVLPAPLGPYPWAGRAGDDMLFGPPIYGDGAGRAGFGVTTAQKTTVYRDGTKIVEVPQVGGMFPLPAADSRYRVEMEATRGAPSTLSTKLSAAWTFRSGHVAGTKPKALPLSAVRFSPPVDGSNTAPPDCEFAIPVTVDRQRDSAAGRIRDLTVQASFDDGATWRPVRLLRGVSGGTALLRHPKGHGFVSLKAATTDTWGNTFEETIVRAYKF